MTELLGGNSDDLPLIDTVERIQGAEREVILFGFTCSDPDQVLSEFLNNPNRLNIAITRTRHKPIVVGSVFLPLSLKRRRACGPMLVLRSFFCVLPIF